jgi:hypothetical protein
MALALISRKYGDFSLIGTGGANYTSHLNLRSRYTVEKRSSLQEYITYLVILVQIERCTYLLPTHFFNTSVCAKQFAELCFCK